MKLDYSKTYSFILGIALTTIIIVAYSAIQFALRPTFPTLQDGKYFGIIKWQEDISDILKNSNFNRFLLTVENGSASLNWSSLNSNEIIVANNLNTKFDSSVLLANFDKYSLEFTGGKKSQNWSGIVRSDKQHVADWEMRQIIIKDKEPTEEDLLLFEKYKENQELNNINEQAIGGKSIIIFPKTNIGYLPQAAQVYALYKSGKLEQLASIITETDNKEDQFYTIGAMLKSESEKNELAEIVVILFGYNNEKAMLSFTPEYLKIFP